ncbi:hypothetical protein E4V01_21940 [Methylorubrum sp. Q1]|uniref:hypothetical protein n=1 Tax=Methylorubrum sp. Q1 TaxID=2562453 RepID=UPI001075E616|nr:hypothetical protein [Methylorubrum sp. Q1]TFZ55587.1 hypothetical protein E4V01_21940 [Methylorubrum sp. Q1]
MTPANPDALADALAYLKPHETNGGTISLKASKAREAVDVIEAALQRVTAEYDRGLDHRDDLMDRVISLKTSVAAAEARAAQLQAEVEALRTERASLRADAAALGARLGNASQYDDRRVLRDLCWEAGNFLARRIVRPVLPALAARAANTETIDV